MAYEQLVSVQSSATSGQVPKANGSGGYTWETPKAYYEKPSGGIPKSDLASAVQTSLGKADSAYQKPSGGIPGSDLATAYAPIASPTLTGTPKAPTASAGTNTTQIATTEFVTTATSGVYKRSYYQQGTTDIAMRPLVDYARANRFAFLPPDQIIIEKTTDGGTTWVDAEINDTYKRYLFSTRSGNVQIPLLNGAKSTQCGVRVTISGMKYNVPDGTAETGKYAYWNSTYVKSNERYCNLREMWFWVSANNDTIRVQVQRATGANPDTWKDTFTTDFGMSGWPGSDWTRWDSGLTFGGGVTQTGNYWNWRIYFWSRIPGGKTEFQSATQQSIVGINAYGDSVWVAPNGLAEKDHLYEWDYLMNATFPAKVTATGGFAGNITGNVTGNVSGTATTATNVSASAATANSARHVWFSDSSAETKRAYDDDFKYNPSTNVLTVGSISGTASNVSGTVAIEHGGTGATNANNALANLGGYAKPSGGIPATDLAESYYLASNPNGYTSNTGTVKSVRVQATSPVQSSTSTAQSASLNTTISLASGYGDTQNPYGSKDANKVLAAPNGSNGVPTFRALVAADIPSIPKSKISDFPTSMEPTSHASTHALGGTDAIAPSDIGAVRFYASLSDLGFSSNQYLVDIVAAMEDNSVAYLYGGTVSDAPSGWLGDILIRKDIGGIASATALGYERAYGDYRMFIDEYAGDAELDGVWHCLTPVRLTISSVSSLPTTVNKAAITSSMVVTECISSNPLAQTGDWTITTANGSVTVSGSINGTTDITLTLCEALEV